MKKGLAFVATACTLTLGLVACGKNGGGSEKEYTVTISNKENLLKDWYVGDPNRSATIVISDGVITADAFMSGDLVVTSSNTSIVEIKGNNGLKAVAEGESTITATYKGKFKDEVKVTVNAEKAMRVVTDPQVDTDYMLAMTPAAGTMVFAQAEKNGYYIKSAEGADNAAAARVVMDAAPDGDYKYNITLKASGSTDPVRTIGTCATEGHVNIGFIDEYTESYPYATAKWKLNSDFSYSTKINGTEYWLGTYGSYNTFSLRSSSQIEFKAHLMEYGEPIVLESVILDKTTLALETPASATLRATLNPNTYVGEVEWSSDNPAVAIVSKGKVTAVSAGTATITATCEDKTASCTVTVTGDAINFGTEEAPLTVAAAKAVLDKCGNKNITTSKMYVQGLVSTSEAENATYKNRNIWLTDGETEKAFELYQTFLDDSIEGIGSEVDALKGFTVTACGWATLYNTTYELTNNDPFGKKENAVVLKAERADIDLEDIELDKATAEVNVESTVTLKAIAKPTGAKLGEVSWSSDNEAVATVANGVVTGVAEGTATITATCEGHTASCVVTVLPKGTTDNYGTLDNPISPEQAVALLTKLGDNVLTPQKMFVKGIVTSNTAQSSGRTNVWLKNEDGSVEKYFELYSAYIDSSVEGDYSAANSLVAKEVVAEGWGIKYVGSSGTATYEFTNKNAAGEYDNAYIRKVNDGPIPELTGIELNKTEAEIDVAGSVTLTAAPVPAGATLGEVSWSSDNEAVATVANGVVTGVAAGSAIVTATAGGFSASCTITVKNAGEVLKCYKKALFGADYNSESISSYTSNWSSTNEGFTVNIVNANNNKNEWDFIGIGSKSADSTATLTTATTIDKAIEVVTLNIKQANLTANMTSLKLKISSDGTNWTDAGEFTYAVGEQSVTLATPTENLYYQIEAVCTKASSNGFFRISSVDFMAHF